MIPPPHTPPMPQERRHYICRRASSAPGIDGRVDKPFWRDAPWTDEFVDIEGDAKPRPAYRTRAKLLWDDTHLYVAAEMEEPHIWATLSQRDSIVYHDNDFEVFLSPTGDNHRYYELEINALNTVFDLFLAKPYRDGGPADHAWDVRGLISAVHIDGTLNDPRDTDRGWSVELALPWSAFDRHGGARCPPRDGDQWRLNFSRVQWDLDVAAGRHRKIPNRPEHNWVWSPQGVTDMHRPEQWGYLQFSSRIAGSGQVAFRPNESEPVRDALHRLYYAQLAYKAARGRWAADLAELGLTPGHPRIAMDPNADGWVGSIRVDPASGPPLFWRIRQDSLIWAEPAP